MLAMMPEMVATMASPIVSHSPHGPTAGRAASASDELLRQVQLDLISLLLRLQAWPAADQAARQELVEMVELQMKHLQNRLSIGSTCQDLHSFLTIHQEAVLKLWETYPKKLLQTVTDAAVSRLNRAEGTQACGQHTCA